MALRFIIPSCAALALVFTSGACGSDGAQGDDDDDDDDNTVDGGGEPDGPPTDWEPDIDAERNTWTWLPVAGTQCMDGSPTGIGVNLAEASRDVLIVMEGGGACFNTFTCNGVAHQNGFDDGDLASMVSDQGSKGVFARDDQDNPFRNYHLIFVPYCTGDIFAGANPDGFGGRTQVGYTNVTAILDVLVPAFAGARRVVLSGVSAGGFGAMYNYHRTQVAFGDIPVTLLDDSGPPLSDTYTTPCMQQTLRTLWNLEATLPADCTECTQVDGGGLGNMAAFAADAHPDRRLGLVTSTRDGVIRLFLGQGYPSCPATGFPMPEADFAAGVAEFRDVTLADHENFRVFSIDSGLHTWLFENPVGSTSSGGVKLTDWIRALLAGNGEWTSVAP